MQQWLPGHASRRDLLRDMINGVFTLTYGGVLKVLSSGRPLAAGDSLKLFEATHYLGQFDSIAPSSPANGLAWDVSRLSEDGTLLVKRVLPSDRN
jgi:hypothetical protein